ncbi:hypothetical protein [Aestuariibaculum sediminum]|uniref:Lipoprotein n=1 Tax=Aestuariibaculum sediminum TaxID=2770637 RepID=A0A8J6PYM9_9FLAO|nr:hypothetical protein [Aestuariibaculum sediminum]MBD0831128.1 hypothetical protein [Aestuariibaculum sediminum]
MRISSLLLVVFLSFSCTSSNDIPEYCAAVDYFTTSLYIKITDQDGTNLIENETYISNYINLEFRDLTIKNAVDPNKNLISFLIFGEEGNNTLKINLAETDSDILILNLSTSTNECNHTFYTLNKVTYQDISLSIEKLNNNYYITIVK